MFGVVRKEEKRLGFCLAFRGLLEFEVGFPLVANSVI